MSPKEEFLDWILSTLLLGCSLCLCYDRGLTHRASSPPTVAVPMDQDLSVFHHSLPKSCSDQCLITADALDDNHLYAAVPRQLLVLAGGEWHHVDRGGHQLSHSCGC